MLVVSGYGKASRGEYVSKETGNFDVFVMSSNWIIKNIIVGFV